MPEIIDMLKEVKCLKDTKMYCLETCETMIVPAGTVVFRWTHDEKNIKFTYYTDDKSFERELGIKYLKIGDKFEKCKPLFQGGLY